MGRIVIDESYYPIYRVVHEGTVTDAEFAAYLDQMTASMYRPDSGPRIVFQDGTGSYSISASQRSMQADWMKQYDARIREVNMGTVFIVSSPLMRGALTAVLWLHRLPVPHHVCATMAQALLWSEQVLAAHGMQLPASVRQALTRAGLDSHPAL